MPSRFAQRVPGGKDRNITVSRGIAAVERVRPHDHCAHEHTGRWLEIGDVAWARDAFASGIDRLAHSPRQYGDEHFPRPALDRVDDAFVAVDSDPLAFTLDRDDALENQLTARTRHLDRVEFRRVVPGGVEHPMGTQRPPGAA